MIRVDSALQEAGEGVTPPQPEIPDRVLDQWQGETDEEREMILTFVPEADVLIFEDAIRLAFERNEESALRLEEAALAATID